MPPFRIFLFVFFVFLLLSGISILCGGRHETSGFVWYIPEWAFAQKKSPVSAPEKVLQIIRSADTLEVKRTEEPDADTVPVRNNTLYTGLQYRKISDLGTLFAALKNQTSTQPVHILHYGDSQIECDRITDYLRMKLQNQFGGQGPGIIGLKPLTQGIGCKVFAGEEWERHVTFLGKNKDVPHNCFGPAAILYRFTPYWVKPDSMPLKTARVAWQVNALAGKNMTGSKKMRLLYGGGKCRIWMELYENGILTHADSLDFGSCELIKEFPLDENSTQKEIRFYGKYSPDFYGISLESDKGVYVDNIAQRGSSGTFFHLININQLRYYYHRLNIKGIFLQFGGNALPALKNAEQVKNYTSYIRGQMGIIRKILPEVTVIFIGPSDISVREGTEFITHPMLETLRDELKKVVLEAGMVYFDLYDCMGGKNSMSVWVKEKLAADDYIHFSSAGARKIATLLHKAIMNEYHKWLKNENP